MSTRTIGGKHSALPLDNRWHTTRLPRQLVKHSTLPRTTGALTLRLPIGPGEHKKLINSSLYEKIFDKSGHNQQLAYQT